MGIGVNIKKIYNFLKANGLSATVYEIKGRLNGGKKVYRKETPDEETLEAQRKASKSFPYRPLISILIPLYNSDRKMLEQLLVSIFAQTYDNFEVVLADGSEDEGLGEFIRHLVPDPGKINYTHLAENGGISKNTNRAIEMAKGDYYAFADHDDLLEPDALYEVVKAINEHLCVALEREIEPEIEPEEVSEASGQDLTAASPEQVDTTATAILSHLPTVLYTDEDKCDESGKVFYDPVRKPDFDPLYLLSNNYICHLTLIKGDIVKNLLLRPKFDGAQDQDILLRAVMNTCDFSEDRGQESTSTCEYEEKRGQDPGEHFLHPEVLHIPKVLYHWRVAGNSTSGNTSGKRYAYEAGRRAAQEALDKSGIKAESYHTMHVGVYGIDFKEEPLVSGGFRNLGYNAGAMGGLVVSGKPTGRIIAGPSDHIGSFKGKPAQAGVPSEAGTLSEAGTPSAPGALHCPLIGLPAAAGGPHNRRFITRGVDSLDIRCIKLSPELYDIFKEVTGIEYTEIPLPFKYDLSMGGDGLHNKIQEWEKIFDFKKIPAGAEIDALSRKLCKAIRDKGYSLIYIPEWETIWK